VSNSPEKPKPTPEQQRLTGRHYTSFVRSGAKLDAGAKKRVGEINQRLASLYTNFSQNVLADEENYMVVIEKEADLEGLPDSFRSGAAAAAKAKGMEGKWVISNTRSSVEPFLAYSTRDDLREKVWKNFVNRGDNGDARDNKKIISEILKLRAERAKLLGYETHAHWRLENSMAKTPARAMALMEEVWPAAVSRVKEEVGEMQGWDKKSGVKGKNEVDDTAKSKKWKLPSAYYKHAKQHVEFFALDTNMQMFGQDKDQKSDISSWIKASTATWKIAFGHHPYKSNGPHGNAGDYEGQSWIPITNGKGVKNFLEDNVCGGVDLYVSGHDHSRQWLNESCKGTERAISGAGAKATELGGKNPSLFESLELGFLYIKIVDKTLTAEFIDENGVTEFTHTMKKP